MPPVQTDYEVDIEEVVFGGDGLARIDGKVVFVPGTLPGEKVKIRLLKDKGDFWTARILEILKPSRSRIKPEEGFLLPVTSLSDMLLAYSPGYAYYYAAYAAEVKLKQAQFQHALEKIPGFRKTRLLKPFSTQVERHYRNKITLHFQDDHGERKLGYIGIDNHNVLDLDRGCPLACEAINAELNTLRQKSGFLHSFRDGMTFTLRYTPENGVVSWRNEPPKNLSWLKEQTPMGTVSVPAGSFFQVNPHVAPHLIEQLQSWLAKLQPEVVFDLYCGVGLFGLAAAYGCPERTVIGIDSDPGAIEAARYNAKNLDLPNCRFESGRADMLFSLSLEDFDGRSQCLIVDPPRTGLHPAVTAQIANSNIRNMIYISCSPDTLVRDLMRLSRGGFTMESFQMADMFPRTPHFETLTLLKR